MEVVSANIPRRTANYKPNIWNYDRLLQSFTSNYNEEKYVREAETLKEGVRGALKNKDPFRSLELIDLINKLALSHYFEKEISECVNEVACMKNMMHDDLYSTALYFRILRQHGYHVLQDGIVQLLEDEKLMTGTECDDKAVVEIFEASHLEFEDEFLFDRAKAFAANLNLNSFDDDKEIFSEKCPTHWSVSWFNAKKYINPTNKSLLHRLAGLSFNMIQVQHQMELKEILRWWRKLDLLPVLTFTRDRVVESFLWAVGVAYEPQYSSLRKWLTKAIVLVLIIDDVYDIYGSNIELDHFTNAVERWDPSEIEELPEAIRRCFWTLYDTAEEMDREVQKEKGCKSILPHLKKVWTGFCKALHVEANWYHTDHFPSLSEYLDNGWTSSSGPVLSLHALVGVGGNIVETMAAFNSNQDIIHQASLIIRLCNDKGTSKAELERGDAPSSIRCYMREENATEEEAREHIRKLVSDSWKKINGLVVTSSSGMMMRYVVNTARVANFIYQNGDGFGNQDRETRAQVLSCLIEPLSLDSSSS
ncbi:hypothetical protein ACS0TY_031163 [Phlomoides rotata]